MRDFNEVQDVVKYDGDYYCNVQCLGEHLVDNVEYEEKILKKEWIAYDNDHSE
jgi:hypothetical protein